MTKRILIAMFTGMALLRPTFAQPPAAAPAQAEATPGTPTPALGLNGGPQVGLPVPPAAADPHAVPQAPCMPWEKPCANMGGRCWVTGEYLFAWLQGTTLPALVTTSPAGTPRATAGVLGVPTTSPVIGGVLGGDLRSGARFQVGCWFDSQHTLGIEAGTMILESQAIFRGASSDGTTILARPYIDANTAKPQAVLVAFPGSSAGSVNVKYNSGNFYEAHIDAVETFLQSGGFRLTSLVGYRFFRYDDALTMSQTVLPTGGAFAPGTRIDTTDAFRAHNTFNGVDLGLRGQFFWNNLTLSLLGKIAAGYVHRDVFIAGNQTVSVPGAAPVTQTGGVYALSSNIGTHGSNDWGLLPELGINLAWQVNPYMRLNVGYTILWLDRVARAADQVNLTLNPNLFPPAGANPVGPNQPAFTETNRQDVRIQALSVGLTLTY